MDCEYKDGSILEDEHLVSMMIALLFAGQHTSSITGVWTGLNILRQKQYLKEVQDEIAGLKKELGDKITFDFIKKETQLENCIRESLRMYPPLIQLVRKVMKPIQYKGIITTPGLYGAKFFPGYTIPAGHLISVSPSVGMRIPEAYTNPDSYDPHRFDRGEHNTTPFHFIAFGGGKYVFCWLVVSCFGLCVCLVVVANHLYRHGCPGENFGILQVKTIWTVLLETYDLEWVDAKMPDFEFQSLVIGPKAPCTLRYKKKASAK